MIFISFNLNENSRRLLPMTVRIGNVYVVSYFMEKIDDKNPKDQNGWTQLHEAAKYKV